VPTTIRHGIPTGFRSCALLVVAVLCLLTSSAARSAAQDHAQPDRQALQVSLDGSTWTESINRSLFDPEVRWVPGDVRDARFFVRNAKPEQGDLRVVLQRVKREALLDTGFLTVAARVGAGPWVEIEMGGRHELIDSADVASGAEVPVELRASLSPDAPNRTMVLATDLDLQLTLTQAGVVDDATSGDPDGPNGSGGNGDPDNPSTPDVPTGVDAGGDAGDRPFTDRSLGPWPLPLALLLLGAGAVLVARRTNQDEDSP
jgi:hypothetical protein